MHMLNREQLAMSDFTTILLFGGNTRLFTMVWMPLICQCMFYLLHDGVMAERNREIPIKDRLTEQRMAKHGMYVFLLQFISVSALL
jgi:hypothetical protein